jgi:hypothetical protein
MNLKGNYKPLCRTLLTLKNVGHWIVYYISFEMKEKFSGLKIRK